MNFIAILTSLRIQDYLDILFLTIVAYYLYCWFRGTKAFKALIGLLVLGIIFTGAQTWGLFLTTWVFHILWQVLVILLIILFQTEIRQVLEKVNPLKVIGFHKNSDSEEWIPGFTEGLISLAKQRLGALIVIEKTDKIEELISGGQILNSEPNHQLLTSIFHKNSPLHDGAIIIRAGQIALTSCYLPLSASDQLPEEWGTRHRAALGLVEKCDALVIVVSEERGEISIAQEGRLKQINDNNSLSVLLKESILPFETKKPTFLKSFSRLITNRWHIKLGSLILVMISWLLLAGQQDFEVSFQIPLEIKNLSNEYILGESRIKTVNITVRGIRRDVSTLSDRNVEAILDLSKVRIGREFFPIRRDLILLPDDRIQVVRIEPSHVEFEIKEKIVQSTVP